MRKLAVLAVLLLIFSSISTAFADEKNKESHKNSGKDNKSDKNTDARNNTSEKTEKNGEKKAEKQKTRENATEEKAASGKEKTKETASEKGAPEEKRVEKKIEEENGNTLGEYISEIEEARRDQWKITKKQLKEMGYRGSMSEFALLFNNYVKEQKKEVREKILNESDENLRLAVVNATVHRELANLAQQLASNVTSVSDENLSSALVLAVNQTLANQTLANHTNASLNGAIVSAAIEEELPLMSEEFKKKLYVIARYGDREEIEELVEQLRKLAKAKSRKKED